MKEDISDRLVSFETAKLAKEKGFDEKCSHYYILDFLNFKADGVLYKCGLPENWDNPNIFQYVRRTMQPHLANAPAQSLLQTWLRNKRILVEVFPVDDWEHWSYKITLEDSMAPMFVAVAVEEEWSSYEEALEAGLLKGLEQIN